LPGVSSTDIFATSPDITRPTTLSTRLPVPPPHRLHRRSVGFLDREGEIWSCFLVTHQQGRGGSWKGYFSFRPRDGDGDSDLIRTADIFVEQSEGEIDRKARGLGRPLLSGLLASALHTRKREVRDRPRSSDWYREMLKQNSRELSSHWEEGSERDELRSLEELRSIYSSYRIDQVAHFISLVEPGDFQAAVDKILDGQRFDFGARDRLQFAMMVVERIESLLPLPPFKTWVEDYLAHPEAYRIYAHQLHRHGQLP